MYVGRIMHTKLVTVSPETTLVAARKIVEEKNIDHLLVVDEDDVLVGVISDRDLKQNWASPATSLSAHELTYLLEKVVVKMIMVKAVVTVSPDTTVERAAYIMQTNNINSLPVMKAGKLVGIITSTDVMGVLLQAIGLNKDSVRLAVLVHDSIGALAEVATLLKQEHINIESLFSWPLTDHPVVHQLVFRVDAADGLKAANVLSEGGYKVITKYEEDITKFLPET